MTRKAALCAAFRRAASVMLGHLHLLRIYRYARILAFSVLHI